MRRIAILLLVFTGSLQAADPEIEFLNDTESAFELGGSRIVVEIRDSVLRGKKDMLLDWVVYSAETVVQYYGRFPVDNLHINVQVAGGYAVRFGQAFGGESPFVRVVVGEHVTTEALRRDWIMVHEMVHLAMADVPEENRWWLEGLSTYVESIARAQTQHLSEEFIWRNFIECSRTSKFASSPTTAKVCGTLCAAFSKAVTRCRSAQLRCRFSSQPTAPPGSRCWCPCISK